MPLPLLIVNCYLLIGMPAMRLELIPPCGERILSPQCLPFHHAGNKLNSNILYGIITRERLLAIHFLQTLES